MERGGSVEKEWKTEKVKKRMDIPREPFLIVVRTLVIPMRFVDSEEHRPFHW